MVFLRVDISYDPSEGSWKEVKFTQAQLVAESACHKRCNCTNNLENQDIDLWIDW
jgi:hypothetical protein